MDMTDYVAANETVRQAETLSSISTSWFSLYPATIELDRNLCISNWSLGAEVILGFNTDETVGQDLGLIFWKSEIERIRELWQGLIETGNSITCYCACLDKYGQVITCEGVFSVTLKGSEITYCLTLGNPDFASTNQDSMESMLDELNNLETPWLIF